MAHTRTGAGNIHDEPRTFCNVRKKEIAHKQTHQNPTKIGRHQRDTGDN